jgi:uncharacterized protein YutE (UPF0331/DUF86 family)
MAALDKDKILRYKAEVKEARKALEEITNGSADDYVRDSMKVRALKYTLIILVEGICNLCRHFLAKKAYLVVEEYMETILKMQEKGFLSKEISDKLVPLTKLRHQLIHGYWKTDDRRLYIETKDNLNTIDAFLSEIEQFLSNT